MNDDFRQKLIRDLEDSGFGSEMRALQVFVNKDWNTAGGFYYFDKDHRQTREIDISAYKYANGILPTGNQFRCWFHIVGEVKKSEKPWVVFKGPPRFHHTLDAWNNLIAMPGLPFSKSVLVEALSAHSVVRELGWMGYGIHESLKKPDAPSRWYSSFITASKAAQYVFEANADPEPREGSPVGDLSCTFVKPVVVFDGQLFAASMSETSSVTLEEIQFATFDFPYWSESYEERTYRVDVVQASSLESYLHLSEQRQIEVVSAVCSIPENQWDIH